MYAEQQFTTGTNESIRVADDHVSTARVLYDQAKEERIETAMQESVAAASYAGQAKGWFINALKIGFGNDGSEAAIINGNDLLKQCEKHLNKATEALKARRKH